MITIKFYPHEIPGHRYQIFLGKKSLKRIFQRQKIPNLLHLEFYLNMVSFEKRSKR